MNSLFPFVVNINDLVNAIAAKDFSALWEVVKTSDNELLYWRKLFCLWKILSSCYCPIRLVCGIDGHYWIEADFPETVWIFDWNYDYYCVRLFADNPSKALKNKSFEPISVFDRFNRREVLVSNSMYLIDVFNDWNVREQFEAGSEELETILQLDGSNIQIVEQLCCSFLRSELDLWNRESYQQIKVPQFLKIEF